MVKRYACHVLYKSAEERCLCQVVEVEEGGRLLRYYPLSQEQPCTEWLGGVFVLLPAGLIPLELESPESVWQRCQLTTYSEAVVWRVEGLSLSEPDFSLSCRWKRLF